MQILTRSSAMVDKLCDMLHASTCQMTLECGLAVTQGHQKGHNSIDHNQ